MRKFRTRSPGLEILSHKNLQVGVCSRGISKITDINQFLQLQDATYKRIFFANSADIYVGWGNKKSGRTARKLARKSGKPFLLLEDAFIRSYAPKSISKDIGLGVILDDQGIFYDAHNPCRLENLIKENHCKKQASKRGNRLISYLSYQQVSKYNNYDTSAANLPSNLLTDGFVLVVDQTWKDLSVIGAGANESTFARMIEAAIDENPGQNIVVKLHPEVLAGKKKGYLKNLAIRYNCTLLADNINPWQLFGLLTKIYTVSSQLGFEALMAGCQVRCFGMPFYAGWGLTIDETSNERRRRFTPTIGQLADAALCKYARYIDAYDGTPRDIHRTIDQIALIRDTANQNKRLAAFCEITRWKKKRIKQMFKPAGSGQTFFSSHETAISAAAKRGGDLVAWASRVDQTLDEECTKRGVKLQRLEDGFIRSVGLGANFHLPMSLIIDDLGIYYDPGRPSRLEEILQNQHFDDALLTRAERLINTITQNDITKYNLDAKNVKLNLPETRHIIFVPGQVDDDASIKFGGNAMTGEKILETVRHENPQAFIVFKPHPDVISGQRPGLSDKHKAEQNADVCIHDVSVGRLIEKCDEVHTISSLTGFETLLRKKPVHCHGLPFYAGWGLTVDRKACPRRTRKLSLEMLVAGTLINYPRYFDPVSILPCGPEQTIKRIEEFRLNPPRPSLLIRCRSAFGKLRR